MNAFGWQTALDIFVDGLAVAVEELCNLFRGHIPLLAPQVGDEALRVFFGHIEAHLFDRGIYMVAHV